MSDLVERIKKASFLRDGTHKRGLDLDDVLQIIEAHEAAKLSEQPVMISLTACATDARIKAFTCNKAIPVKTLHGDIVTTEETASYEDIVKAILDSIIQQGGNITYV